MEKRIKEAFDHVQMSPACQNKIIDGFQHRSSRPWIRYATTVAASLLMLFVLFGNPHVVQALEKTADTIKKNVTSLFFHNNPTDPTAADETDAQYIVQEQHVIEDGAFIVEQGTTPNGGNYGASAYKTGSIPEWLELTEDGLFFHADGQRIEISSLITEEIPFTYQYTNSKNLTYYIIVGGTYTGGDNLFDGSIGWAFWLQNAEKAKIDPASAWIGGYSTSAYKNGTDRPWYQEGKKLLGVPFP